MSDAVATFDELHHRLKGSSFDGLGTKALSQRVSDGFFVEPQFDVIDDTEDAAITLLSARGAAGKSTTANELSRLLGAPVWRLQDDDTASSSLVELVFSRHLDTLDWKSKLFEMDRPLLIIDSLDEARARVSASSWSEFVDALKVAVKTGLRLLLLGRTLTLEDIGAQFEGEKLGIAWFEVSHFDVDAQAQYVDARVGASKHPVDVSQGMYREARDAVLSALRAPLEGDGADKFVGYPPVLEAVVALLLGQKNHQTLVKDFQSANPSSRAVVLYDILNKIMFREQTKLAGLATNLGLQQAEVYTQEEQAGWLLHKAEGAQRPSLDHIADGASKQRYCEETEEFRRDHPFLNEGQWASPVFQAYVLTLTFDEAPIAALRAAGNASGMLFELLSVADRGELSINEAQFAALHTSLMSGQQHSAVAAASISQEGDTLQGELSLGEFGAETTAAVRFSLVPDTAGLVVLSGPLASLTVDVMCDVHVPAQRDDVVLGPDLSITAGTISVDGVSAAFGRRDSSEGGTEVFLSAVDKIKLPTNIAPPPPHTSALEIESSVALGYPWTEYVTKASSEESSSTVDPRAARFLDRLMDLTRSHGHSGPRAAFFHKLKGRQSLKGEALAGALGVLEQKGVVHLSGDMIFYSEDWEKYRYYSKTNGGLAGSGQAEVWRPILEDITKDLQGD